jgi:hypothetical protein
MFRALLAHPQEALHKRRTLRAEMRYLKILIVGRVHQSV